MADEIVVSEHYRRGLQDSGLVSGGAVNRFLHSLAKLVSPSRGADQQIEVNSAVDVLLHSDEIESRSLALRTLHGLGTSSSENAMRLALMYERSATLKIQALEYLLESHNPDHLKEIGTQISYDQEIRDGGLRVVLQSLESSDSELRRNGLLVLTRFQRWKECEHFDVAREQMQKILSDPMEEPKTREASLQALTTAWFMGVVTDRLKNGEAIEGFAKSLFVSVFDLAVPNRRDGLDALISLSGFLDPKTRFVAIPSTIMALCQDTNTEIANHAQKEARDMFPRVPHAEIPRHVELIRRILDSEPSEWTIHSSRGKNLDLTTLQFGSGDDASEEVGPGKDIFEIGRRSIDTDAPANYVPFWIKAKSGELLGVEMGLPHAPDLFWIMNDRIESIITKTPELIERNFEFLFERKHINIIGSTGPTRTMKAMFITSEDMSKWPSPGPIPDEVYTVRAQCGGFEIEAIRSMVSGHSVVFRSASGSPTLRVTDHARARKIYELLKGIGVYKDKS